MLPTTTCADGDHEDTIAPALTDAIARHKMNVDIYTDIHRHGVAGLATPLIFRIARNSR